MTRTESNMKLRSADRSTLNSALRPSVPAAGNNMQLTTGQACRPTSSECLPHKLNGTMDRHPLLLRTGSRTIVVEGLNGSATRPAPTDSAQLGMQVQGQQLPVTLMSKSWSTPHLAHATPADHGAAQADTVQAGFAPLDSNGSQPVGQTIVVKAEEGVHQASQLPAQGGQDQQQPAGEPADELMTDFSRALGESLHRDGEQQPQHVEPAQAAAAEAHAADEHTAMQDADSSPRLPSKRGPRGTSSRYRGVTRHR